MCGHLMAVVPVRTPLVNHAGDPVPEDFDSGCLAQLAIIAVIVAAALVIWLS
jgi:hypothetical protein